MAYNGDIQKLDKQSDESLVQHVADNKEVFGILIKRYDEKMMRYIRRSSGGSKETVEDIVQNIFIKAYVHLNSFRKGQKFSSWLYGIAHNENIDYWRKNKKHSNVSLDANVELASVLASSENIQEKTISKEKSKKIRSVVNELPEKFKTVLILRYLEDKDYHEIGDILKKPVSTVGTLLYRAKSRLKKLLTESDEFGTKSF